MLAEMPARWFQDWADVYAIDPWGDERDDLRMQRLAWATFQPHSRKRLSESMFALKFTRPGSGITDAAAYKMKQMQRYGMCAAAWDRRNGQADQ